MTLIEMIAILARSLHRLYVADPELKDSAMATSLAKVRDESETRAEQERWG